MRPEVDDLVGAQAEVEATPSEHQAEQPPSGSVGLTRTDFRPVSTTAYQPEDAAQPTTTMPASDVEGAAGAEAAVVGTKVLPPGWKRRTDFGKFKGYVGPQGRKVQTVPLAWAAHAEMQMQDGMQAQLVEQDSEGDVEPAWVEREQGWLEANHEANHEASHEASREAVEATGLGGAARQVVMAKLVTHEHAEQREVEGPSP